jgi:hypothetical protein
VLRRPLANPLAVLQIELVKASNKAVKAAA